MGKEVLWHIRIQAPLGLKVRPEIDGLESVNNSTIWHTTLGVGTESNSAVQEKGLLWNRIETGATLRSGDP